ncbi:MAG TPA: hypothetical protein VIT92_04940 [Burkholderiaceae bacterium]
MQQLIVAVLVLWSVVVLAKKYLPAATVRAGREAWLSARASGWNAFGAAAGKLGAAYLAKRCAQRADALTARAAAVCAVQAPAGSCGGCNGCASPAKATGPANSITPDALRKTIRR